MSNFMFNFTNSNPNQKPNINYQNTFTREIKPVKKIKKHNEKATINKARAWGILTWMLFHK